MAFSKDSIILWALQTYRRKRREYPVLLAERAANGTCIVEHKTPAETEAWLQTVGQAASLPFHARPMAITVGKDRGDKPHGSAISMLEPKPIA